MFNCNFMINWRVLMRTQRKPFIIATTSSVLLAGIFCFTSMAGATPTAHVLGSNSLIGAKNTDSAGSYSYEADKKEGSKSKSDTKVAPSKTEGSKSKAYTHHKGTGSVHRKKEGSGGHKYSHGVPHKGKHGHSSKGHGSSGHKGKHGKNPFKHILCFEKKLGLTQAQVEQIKAGEFEYKKFKVQSHADHAIAHMELDRLVHSGTVDEAKIRSVGERISQIKSGSINAMIEAKIKILKILTPEQRNKVKAMHSKR
jgi:Spy/CpxP family protein refolding chaperone